MYVSDSFKNHLMCKRSVKVDSQILELVYGGIGVFPRMRGWENSFQFSQVNIASKDVHKHREVTEIFTMDVNRVVISDWVTYNSGKDYQNDVDY